MGYYTDYELISDKNDIKIIPDSLLLSRELAEFLTYGNIQDVKWYSHIKEMVELSKHNKDVLIKTSGKGEEFDDIWEAQFLNGKYRAAKAKIVDPCFDDVDWVEGKK